MNIYQALAQPRKRQIIEQLANNQSKSIKQLAATMPISRQAVTKHLNCLLQARLIEAEFVGKEKQHKLHTRFELTLANWLTPYQRDWQQRLENLSTMLTPRAND